jgi:DNA-binding PadR family transcriptional regulator
MDISKYGKHGSSILIYLLKNGEVPITDFSKINIGPTSYYRSLSNLEADGLVKRRETINRRKIVLVALTEKGKEFTEKLVELEQVAKNAADQEAEGVIHIDGEEINVALTPEERENSQYLKFLFHFNVMDNHITVEEAVPGKRSRIFNIYVKQNGHGIFRLWCEADDSYECWHVREAWTYPQVQKMMTQYKGKVKVCPICGTENREMAHYCDNCGAKLE